MCSQAMLVCLPTAATMDSNQAVDCALLFTCLFCFGIYHLYYFTRGHLPPSLSGNKSIDLWTTAKRTRRAWAEDVMGKADDARGGGQEHMHT